MQTSISARHGHLSADNQKKISEKVDKLQRYFDRLTAIAVTVDLEHRDSPTVEVRVSVEHGDDLVARETADEMFAALDGAMHKVEKQIHKLKEKLTDRRTPGHKHVRTGEEE